MKRYNQIRFKGDYAKLKSMGFTFARLFANNYMSWSTDDIFVWKRGAEFQITDFVNHGGFLLDYMLHNELKLYKVNLPLFGASEWYPMYTNKVTKRVTQDASAYHEQMKRMYAGEDVAYEWESHPISVELYETINQFIDLGWIEPEIVGYD